MQPVFTNDKGVSTVVGTPGAVFKVGGARLRIPEEALHDGRDIHFAPSKAQPSKGEPPRLGSAFEVGPALASVGPPFELVLPVPADAGDVVLVMIRRTKAKDGKVTMGFSTMAPKSVEPDKHEALFELTGLPEGDVFLAKKPPSAPNSETSGAASAAQPATSASTPLGK